MIVVEKNPYILALHNKWKCEVYIVGCSTLLYVQEVLSIVYSELLYKIDKTFSSLTNNIKQLIFILYPRSKLEQRYSLKLNADPGWDWQDPDPTAKKNGNWIHISEKTLLR